MVLVGVKGGAEHCVAGGLFGGPLARFLVTFFRAEKSNRPPRRRKEITEENEVGRQIFHRSTLSFSIYCFAPVRCGTYFLYGEKVGKDPQKRGTIQGHIDGRIVPLF